MSSRLHFVDVSLTIPRCEGKKVDADGDVSDKNGNTIGRAERIEDEQPEEAPPEIDYSILIGHKVNKQGAVVNEDDGTPLGKVVEGELKNLIGKKVSKEGKIFNDGGDPIGRAEPLPENERVAPNESPFEDFDPSVVQKNGDVMYEGQKVGEVSEGDPKQLAGKHVDAEGVSNKPIGCWRYITNTIPGHRRQERLSHRQSRTMGRARTRARARSR